MALPIGHESTRRFLEVPFSGKVEDFANWEHHFSSAAALLGYSAFMVPKGDPDHESELVDTDTKSKADLAFYHLLVVLCRAGEASEILRNDLEGKMSGRAAWLALTDFYKGNSFARIGSLFSEFLTLPACATPEASVTFLNRLQQICRDLSDVKQSPSIVLVYTWARLRLPKLYYATTFAQIEAAGDLKMSVSALILQLKKVATDAAREESVLQQPSFETGFRVVEGRRVCYSCGKPGHLRADCRSNDSRPTSDKTAPSHSSGACRYCKKSGHVKADCPELLAKAKRINSGANLVHDSPSRPTLEHSDPRPSSSDAWMVTSCDFDGDGGVVLEARHGFTQHRASKVGSSDGECPFLVDTGATRHMSAFATDFKDLVPLVGHTVTVANGCVLPVPAKGIVTTLWRSTAGTMQAVSIECLYVPGLVARLFSVFRASEQGDKVVFSPRRSYISHGGSEYDFVVDRASFNLVTYFDNGLEAESFYTTHQSRSPGIWHHRLGHVGDEKLRILDSMHALGDCKLTPCSFCAVCVRSRQTNTPQSTAPIAKATNPGDRVHIDLMGPFPPSVSGKRWAMVFVDSATSYVHVAFLAKKSDAPFALEEFISTILTPLKITLGRLFADNGGEFRGSAFLKLSIKYGFRREFSSPGTPAQNGLAERCNRTLMDVTRSLFFHSGAPLILWTCALHTAAYILCRIPSRAQGGRVPLQLWSPMADFSLTHMRVWGCQAYWKTDTHKN